MYFMNRKRFGSLKFGIKYAWVKLQRMGKDLGDLFLFGCGQNSRWRGANKKNACSITANKYLLLLIFC